MTDLYNVSGDNLTDAVCSGGGGVEGVGVVVVGGDLRFSVKRPPPFHWWSLILLNKLEG